jgi:bifunctional enzyme CysN/CysC
MHHSADLIEQDIHAYLDQHEHKTLLRLLTCGSVDDGKSTLIGRLLHDSKLVYEDQLAAIKNNRENTQDGEEFNLALLVDGLQAEREQGITIDVAYRYFSTSKRKFIIADTPGHEQYTRNMVTGASNSDLAIILIDARKGLITQTKRHSYLVSLLGLEHVVVAVNKMDLVDYDEATYEKIKNEYVAFADQLNISKIDFIPLSALKGDNVVNPSENMNWYKGPALLPFLEEVEQTIDQIADGFQLPVQYVNRPNADFRGYCGTLNRGSVAPGDSITVLPSGLTTTVERVIGANGDVDRADSGMAITLTLATEIDISRGDVLVHTQHSFEISNQKKLRSHLVWMDQTPLALDKDYELKLGTRRVNARVDIIHHRVDINTLENVDADTLELNEIGLLDVQLDALLPIQQFTHNKGLGAFILIDKITNATVAAGMISSQQADMVDHHRAEFHIADANKELEGKSAEQIVKWALALEGKAIVTTNFGPQEAVLLQMVNQVAPETEVLWIDSGYNMPQTYKFADAVAKQLDLNLTVYTPLVSAARRDAVMGGIPMIDDPAHEEFSRQFKIEPFLRAMKDTNADVWLTAVRREQTAVRQAMDTVALGPNDVIKVSPLLDWTLADMQAYLKKNGLPDETRYFDPTKVEAGRECGLHTLGD